MLKKLFSTLFILFSLLLWAVPVQAATIPSGYNIWTLQTTTDTHKVWTVKFNMPADSNSLNNTNLYITDDNNKVVNTTLTTSGTSVQIKPSAAFIAGNRYWIFITGNITFVNGKLHLTQPLAIPFIVTVPNSEITSVSDSYSSLITSLTVTTSPEVYSVKINQTYMLYQGNNTYTLGMTALKQGSKVTISAYDSNGKSLQSQTYIVN
ncbi:hypothetical protein REC12_10035 [Desulfosporosinus sp. PR]|uniref:Ig-like domain-containing protein n=1 Tax=Candidatus Desulfosporosinus nitrosoreducens TaxID=3401928 RepID=UPI0027F45D82|nr:Ig-like domain-containing protein [Desulfosporosinus sp. PR]MDQ7093928.1 hypothetical protein [Desulfosporosinus sp. PR]